MVRITPVLRHQNGGRRKEVEKIVHVGVDQRLYLINNQTNYYLMILIQNHIERWCTNFYTWLYVGFNYSPNAWFALALQHSVIWLGLLCTSNKTPTHVLACPFPFGTVHHFWAWWKCFQSSVNKSFCTFYTDALFIPVHPCWYRQSLMPRSLIIPTTLGWNKEQSESYIIQKVIQGCLYTVDVTIRTRCPDFIEHCS